MGYIPPGARWYLADLVLEIRIEGDSQNVVHIDIHLIEADSPDHAYEKAMALGRAKEDEYLNPEGKRVTAVFRGLRDLNVIHEELEDGAELTYEETIGVSEEKLGGWLCPREELAVFAPVGPDPQVPNYCPGEIMEALMATGCLPPLPKTPEEEDTEREADV